MLSARLPPTTSGIEKFEIIIRGNFLGPCMTSVMSNYELKDCNGSDEDLKDLDDEDLMDLLFLYFFTRDWIGQIIWLRKLHHKQQAYHNMLIVH